MPEKVLKAIFILLFSVLGIVLSTQTEPLLTAVIPKNVLTETILGITILSLGVMLIGGILGALVGRVISGYLISSLFAFTSRVEKSLLLISTQDLIIGTLGLFAGLIIANLVGLAFGSIPYIGPYVSVALSIILGYIGMHLTISKKAEIAGWFHFKAESGTKQKKKKVGKLLDTNIIIDGRILNIYQSGFLEGPIIVPVFVLEELQKIADSADVLKRNRGRRGLDILNQIKKKSKDELIILTEDFEEINEVDSKLVKLARTHGYKIITNDYNLNKVAELQGVAVLNINELIIALKPAVIPGEEVYVQLVKNGKEEGQGVAFLDDGTMIVVENGSQFIGQEIPVIIASNKSRTNNFRKS
ncbi:PIN/TRAM domain-containing protein [Dialister invisus]|uniref:PIN/TRAM domain-containing protein n=1 Tax=Dialister invisus TaxID=218538 RepID=UPI0023A7BE58|nr:PIN domain-containing protein [Dialister invisus]